MYEIQQILLGSMRWLQGPLELGHELIHILSCRVFGSFFKKCNCKHCWHGSFRSDS